MSSKAALIGLALAVVTVECSVLKDAHLRRDVRSPCDSCDKGIPPPPLSFRTHQWSGLARSGDGRQQGVFSGAAAALGDESQADGEAFSLASSSAAAGASTGAGAGASGGYRQQSGLSDGQKELSTRSGSYKSNFGYQSKGGQSYGSGSGYGGYSGPHTVGQVEGNQQQIPVGGSFGPNTQSGAYSGYGVHGGQSNPNGGFVNRKESEGYFKGSQGSSGNGYSNGEGSRSDYGIRGDLGNAQQQITSSNTGAQSGTYSGSKYQSYREQNNGFQGRNNVGGTQGSYGGSASSQIDAYQGGPRGFEGNEQQQVTSGRSDGYSGSSGTGHGVIAGESGSLEASANGGVHETVRGALNLASQGLQAANQAGGGCTTCGKSSYAFSNAKSHSGNAVALSIGG